MRTIRTLPARIIAATLTGFLLAAGGGLAAPQAHANIGDPWPDTPGFPLPHTPKDGSGRVDFGIRDNTPAPFTILNYGGVPIPGSNFVNIGDSYTTTTFYGTTLVEPCFHNAAGFGPAVAAVTQLPLRDAACPGAGIENYWHTMKSFQFPVPKAPQRLAINKDSKLVVISLGGNDAYTESMAALMLKCATLWASPSARLTGNPCEREIAPRLNSRAKAMRLALAYALIDAKKRAAHDAVVIAMGYFNPMPSESERCWAFGAVPVGDLKYIHELYRLINLSVREAARAAGVLYYNPAKEEAFARSSCGLPFYRLITVTGFPEGNVPFHPTLTGQWNMAKNVSSLYQQELDARAKGKTIAPRTWKESPDTAR